MPLRSRYQKAPSDRINFSFLDYATGTTTAQIYPCMADNAGTYDHFLLATAIDSDPAYLEATGNTGSDTKVTDEDYDFLVANTVTLQGKAIVSFTHWAYAFNNATCHAKIRIRHWDGTTETEVASQDSPDITAVGGTNQERIAISITLPKTTYKKGDYIRMTVELWIDSDAATTYRFYNDPNSNDTVGGLDTDAVLLLPMLSAVV